MMHTHQKGSTLMIAMLMLLIMLGLTASMTFNAQSQASLAAGAKLQQFYETAAISAFNRARAQLPDYWNDVDPILDTEEDYKWRFGELIKRGDEKGDLSDGNFPEEAQLDYVMDMNAGMLPLTYKVWVKNNPDDPSFMMQHFTLNESAGVIINKNWDMDGKIVLSVEIFAPNDPVNPVATQSAILGPAGGEYAYIHRNALVEGDGSDVGGQGTGTLGSQARIDITPLDN